MSYSKIAQDRYQKEKRRKFTLNFSRLDDDGAKIIEKLESVPSINDYVRQLILRDISDK